MPDYDRPRGRQPSSVRKTDGVHKLLIFADAERTLTIMRPLVARARYDIRSTTTPIGATTLCLRSGARVAIVDESVAGVPGAKLLELFRRNLRLSDVGIILLCTDANLEQLRARLASVPYAELLPATELHALRLSIEGLLESLERGDASGAPIAAQHETPNKD